MGQAVNIRGQQVHLVIALQQFLRRHLALTAIADGLLQLSEARTVDERTRMGQVGRAHGRGAFALWAYLQPKIQSKKGQIVYITMLSLLCIGVFYAIYALSIAQHPELMEKWQQMR